MKPWIKLEYSLLQDARIGRLIVELGIKGLGVYVIVRLLVECRNGGRISLSELLQAGAGFTSRRIIMRVVNDYDLFSVIDGHVCACVRTGVREYAHEGVCADIRECIREGEPIITKEKEKKEKDRDTTVGSTVVVDDCFQKYSDESWFPRIAELLSPNNLIWREPLLMHCGYGALLCQHWTEAVLFFIEHAIIQAETDRLHTSKDCMQYFANFSRITVASGKALMEHLTSLHSKQDAVGQDMVVTDNRPPRPSPTAQWSYATEEWVEVH